MSDLRQTRAGTRAVSGYPLCACSEQSGYQLGGGQRAGTRSWAGSGTLCRTYTPGTRRGSWASTAHRTVTAPGSCGQRRAAPGGTGRAARRGRAGSRRPTRAGSRRYPTISPAGRAPIRATGTQTDGPVDDPHQRTTSTPLVAHDRAPYREPHRARFQQRHWHVRVHHVRPPTRMDQVRSV